MTHKPLSVTRRVIDSTTNKPVSRNGKHVRQSNIYVLIPVDQFKKEPPHTDWSLQWQPNPAVFMRIGFDDNYTPAHRNVIERSIFATTGNGRPIVDKIQMVGDRNLLLLREMDMIRNHTHKKYKISADAALSLLK